MEEGEKSVAIHAAHDMNYAIVVRVIKGERQTIVHHGAGKHGALLVWRDDLSIVDGLFQLPHGLLARTCKVRVLPVNVQTNRRIVSQTQAARRAPMLFVGRMTHQEHLWYERGCGIAGTC